MRKLVQNCTAALFAILALNDARPASAGQCSPLNTFTSVDFKMGPGKRTALVPVTMQGRKKFLLLDTGGTISEITPATVTALGLKSWKQSATRFYDISGNYVDRATVVPQFAIGDLHAHDVDFIVGSDESFSDQGDVAGILGPSVLRFYDVSLDFDTQKLTLLSPGHCKGKAVHWPTGAVTTVPIKVDKSTGHIMLTVTLDGHRLNALLDTGAEESVLNLRTAKSEFKLGETQKDMIPITRLENSDHSLVYARSFKLLNIAGVTFANPTLDIVPDLAQEHSEHPSPGAAESRDPCAEPAMPDMLIGMDILRHLHLYIAYKEQKLYIASASPLQLASATPPHPHGRGHQPDGSQFQE